MFSELAIKVSILCLLLSDFWHDVFGQLLLHPGNAETVPGGRLRQDLPSQGFVEGKALTP